MRILLISMPDNIPFINSYQGYMPNLALRSLAGNLLLNGVEIKILDLIFFQKAVRRVVKRALEEYRPNLVGLTSMTFQYGTAKRIANLIRSFDKDMKILLGGYHATVMYEEIASGPDRELFDFIVRGEGERTFQELVEGLHMNNSGLDRILGLSFKDRGHFIHNGQRPLQDLDSLKLPRREGVDLFKINYGPFGRFEVVETTRGCTFDCNFCSIRNMYGRTYRKFKTERVLQDIKNVKECGTVRIFFADDNITLDVQNLKTLCDAIVENGLNDIYYATQAGVRGIASSEELVQKMREANFVGVFIGIESPLKRNLETLNKQNTIEETKRAVSYLHKYDIGALGGFITANPDDTKEDIESVLRFSKELGCDMLMLQILTPYPKTEVRRTLAMSNMIANAADYSRYNGFWANVRTKFLSPRQIMRKVSVGNIKWYLGELYNPNNWFNKSKRVLPSVRPRIRAMTWNMLFQFCLGRYGKSGHRF